MEISMGYPIWLYHQEKEAEIFDSDDIDSLKDNGWREHWNEFEKVVPEEKQKENMEEAEEADSEIISILNEMSKSELEEYALDNFKINIDKRKSKSTLVDEIKALIDGDSA